MEPTGKRVDFLKYLCGELGLTGVEFAKERAEEAARKIWREQFDAVSYTHLGFALALAAGGGQRGAKGTVQA